MYSPFMPSDDRTFPRCSFYGLFFVTQTPLSTCPRSDFATCSFTPDMKETEESEPRISHTALPEKNKRG